MPEKQLNFLNIFDETGDEPKGELSVEQFADEDDDSLDFNASEQAARMEADKLHAASLLEEKQEEIERRRLALLLKPSPKLSDFEEYLPEIMSYSLRMQGFRDAYKKAPQSEKMFWYEKMVRPDQNDEADFRDSARMYLKYIEVYNEEQKIKRDKFIYEPGRKAKPKTKKNKAEASPLKRPKNVDFSRGKNAAAMLDK